VRTKVLAGFASVLVILIAVSGLSYSNFVFVGHEIDILAEDVEAVALVSHIEAEFLKLKGHAREFANLGHEADAERVAEIGVELTPMIEEALERISAPALNAKLVEIKEEFELYLGDFEVAKGLEHEYKNLILEVLEPNGEAIIEDLDAVLEEAAAEGNADALIYVGVAREHALLARLYANILIGRQDDTFGEKVEHEFAEFTIAMKALDAAARTEKEKTLLADVHKRFIAYEAAFEKIREDELELRALVDGEMKDAADTIARDAEWIEAEISKSEEKVRAEAIAAIDAAELEMIIAGVVGVVVGIMLAWLIGNGITGPIGKMTAVMGRLADGDTSVDIEGAERSDEIGLMAGAVQVFKDNAIAAKRLEEERVEQERQAEADKREALLGLADNLEKSVTQEVSENIASVSQAAAESGSAAAQMLQSAGELSKQAELLRGEVDKFLAEVRAA